METVTSSEQFAAIVAHDLQSSLLVLVKQAELLREVDPGLSVHPDRVPS